MLAHDSLIAFIATAQPERARDFYRDVLGLPLVEESSFALVFDANGTMLRVQKVETLTRVGYTTLGWRVANIQQTIALLQSRGIHFDRYPDLSQDEQGVWTTPAGHKIAWFTDPDGNSLSLTEIQE